MEAAIVGSVEGKVNNMIHIAGCTNGTNSNFLNSLHRYCNSRVVYKCAILLTPIWYSYHALSVSTVSDLLIGQVNYIDDIFAVIIIPYENH